MKQNGKMIKAISAIICAVLVISAVFIYFDWENAVAANTKNEKELKKGEKEIEKTYPSLLKSNGVNKDKIETAYVIMDSNSKLKKVIVSEQLANNSKAKKLKDLSSLKNIENTSGNEKFTRNGSEIEWNAKGNRIYYKGEATKDLPVNVKVSYFLNGERKTPEEIAGKAGNITIRFEYDVKKDEEINGKKYKHPYTMASGLILDNTNFSDIRVEGGKTVDNGSQTIAFGIGFPSMNENLGISRTKLNIPSSVKISAYTDNFNIMGTYTVALSGLFNDIDTGKADDINKKIEELKNGLSKLSDASKSLLKGSDDLSNGALEFENGILEFTKGISNLKDGSDKLLAGTRELSNGLSALSEKSALINQGMTELETSVFENATMQMRQQTGRNDISLTPVTYIQVIKGISDNALAVAEQRLREGLKSQGVTDTTMQDRILSVAYNNLMIAGKAEPTNEEISNEVKNAGIIAGRANFVQKAIEKNRATVVQILKQKGYSDDKITEQVVAVSCTALELAGGNVGIMESKLSQAKEYVMATGVFKSGEINASDNVKKLAAMAVGKKTPEKLNELKENLDSVEALVAGIIQYTGGVDRAAIAGKKLEAGMAEFNRGITKLNDVSATILEGSRKIKFGADKLKQGMHKFDSEGIGEFVNALKDKDLTNILNNLEAVKEASQKEAFIGGKLPEMSGESKIIFKTAEIK